MTVPASFPALRRLSQRRTTPDPSRCELCGSVLGGDHAHLVEPPTAKLVCACPACALLFPARPGVRFKRVPRDVFELPEFDATGLSMPIGLAFFFRSSVDGKMTALYPSPAGPTPASVDEEAWRAVLDHAPELSRMEADVQALLVHRLGGARDTFLLPIDLCYELVGRLRLQWRGISGGEEVRVELIAFFKRLRERSTPLRKDLPHA